MENETDENLLDTEESACVNADNQYNWVEVTKNFKAACQQLELGELVHDDSFTLFEAMSAIEMMDPKMDAGMMCHQVSRKVLNLEQGIQEGQLKAKEFEASELIGLMDDTLCCWCTWLDGHSMAQTVFTNLYLHDPSLIEDPVWKAYCVCSLKIVDSCRDWINRASVFEEEDIQPMSYGFQMMSELSDARAGGMLKEAEEEVQKQIRATKIRPGEQPEGQRAEAHARYNALFVRLKFCRLLLLALTTLSFEKKKADMFEEARRLLAQLRDFLPLLRQSQSLGAVPTEEQEYAANDYPTLLGFEPLANQRLLPPTFPRYTCIMPRDRCWDYLESLLSRLDQVCLLSSVSGFMPAVEFAAEFSKQNPCVLSRSVLQLLLLSPSRRLLGSTPLVDALRDHLKAFMAPVVLLSRGPLANHAQAKEHIEVLLVRAARPMAELICCSGHNRARQRERWAHLLEDLVTLADEAEKVDGYVSKLQQEVTRSPQALSSCCGTWVLSVTLRVMQNYLQAGFELELYAPYEFASVFYYLAEFISQWKLNTLLRAEHYATETEAQQERFAKAQTGGATGKRRSTTGAKKSRRQRKPSQQLKMTQAVQALYFGLFKALKGMEREGRLTQPVFNFADEEVRYNHRFAPFSCLVTPPPISFGQYKNMTGALTQADGPAAADIYGAASKHFLQAKEALDVVTDPATAAEVQAMQRVAKTNMVVAKLLATGHKREEKKTPTFDFSLHKNFPLIKL